MPFDWSAFAPYLPVGAESALSVATDMVSSFSTIAPGLPVPIPSDTAIPGLMRRRVWASPDVASHSLVVLTLPRIYLAPPTGEPRPDKLAAIERSLDIESLLGPLATSIELASIERVRLDLLRNTVRIDHHSARGGRQRSELVFNKPETADTVFSKLWRRLGGEFTLRPYRPETWELARMPLLIMMALALTTLLTSLLLNAVADIYGGTDWITAGFLPGWRAVCVAGGAAVAFAHLWLYRRISKPPERLELVHL